MENLASNLNQLTLGSTCPPRNQPDLGDLFANLSPELRLDIFEMAAAEPRIVNVGHRYGRMVCMDFTPPLLRTRQEARKEALKQYTDVLLSDGAVNDEPRPPVRFRFEVDTLNISQLPSVRNSIWIRNGEDTYWY